MLRKYLPTLLLVFVGAPLMPPLMLLGGLLLVRSGHAGIGGRITHPQEATMSFGGRTATNQVFEAQWSDGFGPFPRQYSDYYSEDFSCDNVLRGPAGSPLIFTYEGEAEPTRMKFDVRTTGAEIGILRVMSEGKDDCRSLIESYLGLNRGWPPPAFVSASCLEAKRGGEGGREAEIVVDHLPKGDYFIEVSVHVEDAPRRTSPYTGEARYVFQVIVDEPARGDVRDAPVCRKPQTPQYSTLRPRAHSTPCPSSRARAVTRPATLGRPPGVPKGVPERETRSRRPEAKPRGRLAYGAHDGPDRALKRVKTPLPYTIARFGVLHP